MPRAAKKKNEIEPDALYVAWQSGAADIDGVSYTVSSGERRRGSDPFVQAHPWLFVPDGTPESERPTFVDAVIERREAETPAPEWEVSQRVEPDELEREDTLQLKRAVTVGVGVGKAKKVARYEKGAVFSARSDFCNAHPDLFEPSELQFTRSKR